VREVLLPQFLEIKIDILEDLNVSRHSPIFLDPQVSMVTFKKTRVP
jgi:hypothetical protein